MTTNEREPIAFDTETHLFRPGCMAPPIVCVSTAKPGAAPVLRAAARGAEWMTGAFEQAARGHVLVVGHNTAYDASCLLARGDARLSAAIWQAYDALGVHCTQVRERLIDIARGSRYAEDEEGNAYRKKHNLAAIAKERLGVTLDKDTWRMGYEALEGTPIDQWPSGAREYALTDARATLDVWGSQEAEVARTRYGGHAYEAWTNEGARQAAYDLALRLMSVHGLRVDQARVRALRTSLGQALAQQLDALRAAGLINPKKGSKDMAAIRKAIEESWSGEGEIPRTPTGKVATAAEVVEQCSHPALRTFVEYAHTEKLLSSFVDKLATAGDMPIHAGFDVLGADSGRTSCRSPNLQQQPRAPGVRECFVARPGHILIACDFDSQEVRTFAQVLKVTVGKSRLAERYQEDPGYDPHSDFAALLLKTSYPEILARKKAKDAEALAWRQRAKAAIFGFPGGMGPRAFRLYARGYGLDLSQQEAEGLRAAYFTFEPYAKDYFAWITHATREGSATMRQLFSGRLRGDCGFTDGANTGFQGLAADASKSALWEVTKACYGAPGTEGSALYGCRPVVFIHDEIIVEAPEDYAHEAAVELDRVMCAAMEELCSDVPARASPALMRRWTKKADAVFDADGRYACWDEQAKEAA